MEILGNMFNIVLFVSAMGSIFTVVSLFLNHILRCTLPLWFAVCQIPAYVVPFLAPDVYLIPLETQVWMEGYRIACIVWGCGAGLLLLCDTVGKLLTRRALCRCRVCDDAAINRICSSCMQRIGLKEKPLLYFGTLDDPVCVTGAIRPAVLLNEAVVKQLTEEELSIIFCHEMTHIQRKHLLLQRIFDYVCILNWCNPLVWLAKKDFALHCETDCDRFTLLQLKNEISRTAYMYTMIRVLELSALCPAKGGRRVGAASFILAKQRLSSISAEPSRLKNALVSGALAAILLFWMLFSAASSREHFYPYPAYDKGTECSEGYVSSFAQ